MHLRSVPEKTAATTIMQSSIQLKSVGGFHQEQGDLNQKVEAIAGNNVLFLAYYVLSAGDGSNREELSIEEYREVDGDVDCTRVMKGAPDAYLIRHKVWTFVY
ncbi:hypothetical protein Tco_0054347 [Tanacetum coccineum]